MGWAGATPPLCHQQDTDRQRLANAWLRLGRSSPQQLGTSGQKRLLEKLPEKPAKWAASGCWDWNKPPASAKSPDAGPVCLPMNNHHRLGSLFLATVPLKLLSYKGLGLMFSASEVQNKPVPRRYIRNAQFPWLRSYLRDLLALASCPAQKHQQQCSGLNTPTQKVPGSQGWCLLCSAHPVLGSLPHQSAQRPALALSPQVTGKLHWSICSE